MYCTFLAPCKSATSDIFSENLKFVNVSAKFGTIFAERERESLTYTITKFHSLSKI